MSRTIPIPASTDIDVRYLLANERTLLAWMRTGLTLIGGGIAVPLIAGNSEYGFMVSIAAIVFGGLIALEGYLRYSAADRAIRRGLLPTKGFGSLTLLIGIVFFACALIFARGLNIV